MHKNTTPISFFEFEQRVKNKVYQINYHYSIYITPKGDILDCGYPCNLGHNDFSEKVYSSLDILPENPFNSCLRNQKFTFKEIPYLLEHTFNLQCIYSENIKLYWNINKVLLGTEDRICQDMGFVKVSINNQFKTFEIVIPNSIFNKKVTGAQQETLEQISDLFNIDLTSRLKTEKKANAKLASEIQQTLNKLESQNNNPT